MPPRKKPMPADTTARITEALHRAQGPVTSAAADELAKKVDNLAARVADDLVQLRQSDTMGELRTKELADNIFKRFEGIDASLAAIHQRGQDHDIAAAARRASVASRLQALEGAARELERIGSGDSVVHEEQLSQSLRNLWLAVAGLSTAVVVLGIKLFAA